MMDFITRYFEAILFLLVFISGIISLIDRLWLTKKRTSDQKLPRLIDYSRSFFPILLLVFVVRSFIVEPYRIPSGSLKPTLETGDFILVNKFAYGLRLPILHQKILDIKEPKHGDIMIFRWPPDPSVNYIKRVVGLPGDHIVYKDKVLIINGKIMAQKHIDYAIEGDEGMGSWKVERREENIDGVTHEIFVRPDVIANDFDIIVPPDHYFAMGDNRDSSLDSRMWGPVPEQNIIGEAWLIVMSWNSENDTMRWSRSGKMIH